MKGLMTLQDWTEQMIAALNSVLNKMKVIKNTVNDLIDNLKGF
jgi:hypothetical protein